MNRSALGALAAAATGVQVGAAIVATRYVAADISPASLAFLRYAIGVACLVPAVAMAARVRFARADILPIAALGIGQFGILIALLNYGLRSVPAGRGALIFASFPLITLVVAALLGHERVTVRKISGILLTMSGVALALGDKILGAGSIARRTHHSGERRGGRGLLRALPAVPAPLPDAAGQRLRDGGGGCRAVSVRGARRPVRRAARSSRSLAWAAIVFIGLSSGTFYVVWLWALKTIPASRVTVFLALSPLTAIVLGVVLLGEPVTAEMVAGVACVAAGLWVANSEA